VYAPIYSAQGGGMKKKLKILKNSSKGFPRDMTSGTGYKPKDLKPVKMPAEAVLHENKIKPRDLRLPAIGTVISRKYKGEELHVKVLENGFEYKGQVFKSISTIAVHIVGSPISGYVFFKLGEKK
jgi:hypothetical protein